MWAGPWSSRHQDEVLAEAKANPGMAALAQGQFQQATNGSSVLFIESVDGSDFKDVFLAQIRPKGNARPSVVVADSGHLTQLRDGSQVVTLNVERASKALHCYVISALRISRIIRRSLVTRRWCSTPTIPTRWTCAHCGTLTPIVCAELNWRITLVFTVFMMALMVVPLSVVKPASGARTIDAASHAAVSVVFGSRPP